MWNLRWHTDVLAKTFAGRNFNDFRDFFTRVSAASIWDFHEGNYKFAWKTKNFNTFNTWHEPWNIENFFCKISILQDPDIKVFVGIQNIILENILKCQGIKK